MLALQRRCWTQERIAEELGVSRKTVNRTLVKLNRRSYERLVKRAAAVKGRQAAQLEHIASEAIEGWEKSKQDAEQVKTVSGTVPAKGGGTTDIDRTETTIKGQSGNPAFLAEARAALADIRKVLGIDQAEEDTGTPRVDEVLAAEERDAAYDQQSPHPASSEVGPDPGAPGPQS